MLTGLVRRQIPRRLLCNRTISTRNAFTLVKYKDEHEIINVAKNQVKPTILNACMFYSYNNESETNNIKNELKALYQNDVFRTGGIIVSSSLFGISAFYQNDIFAYFSAGGLIYYISMAISAQYSKKNYKIKLEDVQKFDDKLNKVINVLDH